MQTKNWRTTMMHAQVTSRLLILAPAFALLAACTHTPDTRTAHDTFLGNLRALCGKAFEGKMVSTDKADAAMAKERLVMHVRDCTNDSVRVPFNVGENRSRTWIVTRTATGLRLKHDHRHEDGSEDKVTQYGGDTTSEGTAQRQEFPVDAFSIAMFERENLKASVTNVWAMEVTPTLFAYELRRANRFFRVEFDTTRAIPAPPPSWGAKN
jgi:hypothetical protein